MATASGMMPPNLRWTKSMNYKVFQDHGKAQIDPKSRKVSNAPDGYQNIRVHLMFAVKHGGRHKARLVAGGHLTPDPIESIYSGFVCIRSLRLVIFLAKLNNLEVWGADIGNAYLEAKTKEKVSLNRLTIRPSQWPKRHFFERCVKCIQTNHCHH